MSQNHKYSFNFHESFGAIMECLTQAEQLELFWMIFAYGVNKVLPHDGHTDKLTRIFHCHIKDRLDKGWETFYQWQKRKEVTHGTAN